jgi:hypothetical protein
MARNRRSRLCAPKFVSPCCPAAALGDDTFRQSSPRASWLVNVRFGAPDGLKSDVAPGTGNGSIACYLRGALSGRAPSTERDSSHLNRNADNH